MAHKFFLNRKAELTNGLRLPLLHIVNGLSQLFKASEVLSFYLLEVITVRNMEQFYLKMIK